MLRYINVNKVHRVSSKGVDAIENTPSDISDTSSYAYRNHPDRHFSPSTVDTTAETNCKSSSKRSVLTSPISAAASNATHAPHFPPTQGSWWEVSAKAQGCCTNCPITTTQMTANQSDPTQPENEVQPSGAEKQHVICKYCNAMKLLLIQQAEAEPRSSRNADKFCRFHSIVNPLHD